MSSIDISIPVYNEEDSLAESVGKLRQFLGEKIPYQNCRIVILDNGSNDSTLTIAEHLAEQHPDVTFIHLDQKGRGRALARAWLESRADIVAYMDVDLSTELADFPKLVDAIDEEGYDIAIGSRLVAGSKVQRCFKREVFSRGYNFFIRGIFRTKFRDAQCGFKALRKKVASELIPLIEDKEWFFDTELLILAEKRGYRIKEIPVTWREDMGSTVKIWDTVIKDTKGLIRLKRSGL